MGVRELEKAWKQAYSVENMAAHGAEGRDLQYIGGLGYGNRVYDFYKDTSGSYWYSVRIADREGRLNDEKKAIFGQAGNRRQSGR